MIQVRRNIEGQGARESRWRGQGKGAGCCWLTARRPIGVARLAMMNLWRCMASCASWLCIASGAASCVAMLAVSSSSVNDDPCMWFRLSTAQL